MDDSSEIRNLSHHDEIESRQSTSTEDIAMVERRTQSWGRTVARRMAVNFMPSRHMSQYAGTRLKPGEDIPFLEHQRRTKSAAEVLEQKADFIATQMEKDENLMNDDPSAEHMRMIALRGMPQCLTVKRSVRARISASVSLKSKRKPISTWKRFKYKCSFWSKRMRRNIRDFVFSVELWYEAIRTVEGHFGSAVATYFYFLRWLVVMSTILSIFIIGFLVVPQVLLTNSLGVNNATEDSDVSIFEAIVTGKGFMENTTMFYGHYSSLIVNVVESLHYNMPYAYFLTMSSLYIAFFIILSIRMATSYRRSFIETGSGLSTIYSNKVFCGWDFGIATSRAASLKSKSIFNELKELLSDHLRSKQKKSCSELCCIILKQIMFHILVLIMLSVVGVCLWILFDTNVEWAPEFISDIRNSAYHQIIIATTVSLIMVLGPFIFSQLARLETYYSPRTNLYVTLIRTFMLEATVLFVLVLFWLRSDETCWETSLGQTIYCFIVFDFVLSLIVVPVTEFLRLMLHRLYPDYMDAPEFDIARNTLGLIYNQTLLWIGLFFAPLLSAIVTIKLVILFYVKRACVLYNCQPSGRAWRATQTQTVFLMLVFLTQLVIIMMFGYIIYNKPSAGCGPFQDFDFIYMVLVNGILQLNNTSYIFAVLSFFTRPGSVAFILIFISIAVYYYRAKAIAEKSMVGFIREMLILEAKDKEFLLTAISKVTEGEWTYNLREDNKESGEYDQDISHKWKFLNESNFKKPSNAGYQFVDSPKSNLHWDQPSTSSQPTSNWQARQKYYADKS